jgi:hypothetical protein
MSIQSGQQLENRLSKQLTHNGYKPITISNEQSLIANFRDQANQHNV